MGHIRRKQSLERSFVLVAATVFFVTAAEASRKVLGPVETSLFYSIYHWPLWLRPLMQLITLAGSSWMVIVVVGGLFLRKKVRWAFQTLLVGLSTYFIVELLKVIVVRPRPFELLSDVQSRERFVTGFGFPSGHTAVTTAVALTLLRFLPRRYWWLVPVWIGLVGISRIYLGVHAPLDIVGGIALGVVTAEGYWLLRPKLAKIAKKKFART